MKAERGPQSEPSNGSAMVEIRRSREPSDSSGDDPGPPGTFSFIGGNGQHVVWLTNVAAECRHCWVSIVIRPGHIGPVALAADLYKIAHDFSPVLARICPWSRHRAHALTILSYRKTAIRSV